MYLFKKIKILTNIDITDHNELTNYPNNVNLSISLFSMLNREKYIEDKLA